ARKSAGLRQGGPPSPGSQVVSPTVFRHVAVQDPQDSASAGDCGAESEVAHTGFMNPVAQLPIGSEATEAAADAGAGEEMDVDSVRGVLSTDAAPPKVMEVSFEGDAAPERKVEKRKVNIKGRATGATVQQGSAAPETSEIPPEELRRQSRDFKPSEHQAQHAPSDAGLEEDRAPQPDRASQPRGPVGSPDADASSDDLSEADMGEFADEWRAAFNRFKAPGEREAHVDELGELLRFLGHGLTLPEHYGPLLREVTKYVHIDFEEFYTFMVKYQKWERRKMKAIFREYDVDGSGEISINELRN
ncbi:unnamed protein product, partial [Prorocentrum cordatum]